MADILLEKPTAGATTTLTPQAEDRLVFAFDSAEATLTREGDNLVMSFEDGSAVNLTNFYEAYSAENMPTFLIEGTEVDGESFFAALGEDLMPAAGNTASAPLGSGSSVDTLAGNLFAGIDRLDGLDQAYPDGFDQEEVLQGDGLTDGGTEGGTDGNTDAGTTDGTNSRANLSPTAFDDGITIKEGDIAAGNLLGNDVAGDSDASSSGKDIVSVRPVGDAWQELTPENLAGSGLSQEDIDKIIDAVGSLDRFEEQFFTPEGELLVVDKETGDYAYVSPPNSMDEGSKDVKMEYTIEDADGEQSQATLTVTVTDVTLEGAGSVTTDDDFVAANTDGDPSTHMKVTIEAELGNNVKFDQSAELPKSPYGEFSYDAHGNLQFTQTTPYSHAQGQDSATESYEVTITDAEGNTGTANITVTFKDSEPTVEKNVDLGAMVENTPTTSGTLPYDGGADGVTSVTVQENSGWEAVPGEPNTWKHTESGSIIKITDVQNGTYELTPGSTDGRENIDFNYVITDADGDPAKGTLSFELQNTMSENFGKEISDGVKLNVAVIVDSSGSLGTHAMAQIETALSSLGESFASGVQDGVTVEIALIDYDWGVRVLEINLEDYKDSNGTFDTEAFTNYINNLWGNGLGATNWEAGFNTAEDWFMAKEAEAKEDGLDAKDVYNYSIFMTDGTPTVQWNDGVSAADPSVSLGSEKLYLVENSMESIWSYGKSFTYSNEDGSQIFTLIEDNGASGFGNFWLMEGESGEFFHAVPEGGLPQVSDSQGNIIANTDINPTAHYYITFEGETYGRVSSKPMSSIDSDGDGVNDLFVYNYRVLNVDGSYNTLGCVVDAEGNFVQWQHASPNSYGKPTIVLKEYDAVPTVPTDREDKTDVDVPSGELLLSDAGYYYKEWQVEGASYQLRFPNEEEAQGLEHPALYIHVDGKWIHVGNMTHSGSGSGAGDISDFIEAGTEAAKALQEAMKAFSDNAKLFGVGVGSFAINDDNNTLSQMGVFDEVLLSKNIADLDAYFTEIAGSIIEQLTAIVAEVEKVVLGEDAEHAAEGDLAAAMLDLAYEGNAERLNSIAENIESSIGTLDSDIFTDQTITYGDTDDVFFGARGDETVNGGIGTDVLLGGAGNDILSGGAGNDYLHGGSGDDILIGGEGNDILFGGSGNDTIFAGKGDIINGGDGHDIIQLESVHINDILSIDGGDDDSIDVLLSGLNSVTEVQELFANGNSLQNMEVIMLGDDMQAAKDLQNSLANDKSTALENWQQGNEVTIGGNIYREYTKTEDDNTSTKVLIESNLLG